MIQRIADYPIISGSVGELTNPTSGTVMADTGPLMSISTEGGAGWYEVLVVASATAAAEFSVQRRDAQNANTVGTQFIFYAPASNAVSIPLRFQIERGERIRVVMNANLTGDAVANVCAQRVA